jgi:hypothetical protein
MSIRRVKNDTQMELSVLKFFFQRGIFYTSRQQWYAIMLIIV